MCLTSIIWFLNCSEFHSLDGLHLSLYERICQSQPLFGGGPCSFKVKCSTKNFLKEPMKINQFYKVVLFSQALKLCPDVHTLSAAHPPPLHLRPYS